MVLKIGNADEQVLTIVSVVVHSFLNALGRSRGAQVRHQFFWSQSVTYKALQASLSSVFYTYCTRALFTVRWTSAIGILKIKVFRRAVMRSTCMSNQKMGDAMEANDQIKPAAWNRQFIRPDQLGLINWLSLELTRDSRERSLVRGRDIKWGHEITPIAWTFKNKLNTWSRAIKFDERSLAGTECGVKPAYEERVGRYVMRRGTSIRSPKKFPAFQKSSWGFKD